MLNLFLAGLNKIKNKIFQYFCRIKHHYFLWWWSKEFLRKSSAQHFSVAIWVSLLEKLTNSTNASCQWVDAVAPVNSSQWMDAVRSQSPANTINPLYTDFSSRKVDLEINSVNWTYTDDAFKVGWLLSLQGHCHLSEVVMSRAILQYLEKI